MHFFFVTISKDAGGKVVVDSVSPCNCSADSMFTLEAIHIKRKFAIEILRSLSAWAWTKIC